MVITNQNLQIIHKKLRERHPHITLKKIIKPQEKKPGQEKRNREELRKQPENNQQIGNSTYLSIIPLNVNGLNVPIIRHRVAERIEKTKQNKTLRPIHMLPTSDSLQI